MGRFTHLILLLSALCTPSPCVSQHHYLLVTTPKTWYEAQSYCREKCYDLATIDDMEEMERVLTTVEGKYNDAVWIGLTTGNNGRWHWSLADKDLYREGERNYFIWGSNTKSNCADLKYGKMYQIGCDQPQYPLCFDVKKSGREQYVVVTMTMTWTVARDHCRTHYTDLASVRNEEERQIINNITGDRAAWIGLTRDTWQWSDQTYSSMRYWRPGQHIIVVTLGQCAAMLKSESGKWESRSCTEVHPFLCHCPIDSLKFIQLRIKSQDSVLDVNDPAVLDTFLRQIEQKLMKNLNVSTALQLRWKKHPDGRVFIKEKNGTDVI